MTKFPAYPDICGWNALLPERTPTPRAEGDLTARYAVIGAGFTGLAAAARLAELDPQATILVIEATTVGEGSSARNSGFASPRDLPGSTTPADLAAAAALDRFGEEGWDWLMDKIEQHGIACDLQRAGRIKAAATDLGAQAVDALHRTVQTLGIPHHRLDTAALQARIGTSYYKTGLYTEEGYLLQPAALIRGLADALPQNVHLHENTPLQSLRRHQGKWHLTTPTARITADTVVMATNAAIRHFGYLRDRLVTIYTYAAITQPIPAPHLGQMPDWGLLPSHRLGTTVRRISPDRLMVRSLYAHERPLDPAHVHQTLLSCFHRRYPALSHIALEHIWGGTTALTMNGAPWWGEVDQALHTSAGCNGSGIVKGTVLGKRLAEHITGHATHTDIPKAYGRANWVAPEPFRSIGFTVVSALGRRKAGLEA